ncbi:Outer membrane protein TolC [Tangfeifania diversioriginum]|uniref:Outer membrane protein TolC n=1 Tax=Tangfeifania diversioriginum TaxID=1168035 RepID=A0A1M6MLW2_9BACT|nr:TolC family protein [Tangfeifania diversioriginum]SHJ84376.1 Outer membrane protein TolC [Tangfeifania diversioriginum]
MKQLVVIVLMGLLQFPEAASSQEHYTLNKLLKNAVENSHAMKKATLQESESNAKRKEIAATGLPQVEGDLSYSRMGIPDIEIPQEMAENLPENIAPLLGGLSDINALHTSSAGLTVSQLLYSKAYLTGVKQAKKAEELYKVMLQKTEEEVINEVSTMYNKVQASKASLKILDENIEALEQLYEILQLQYENDFVKLTDVSRLKVTVTNLKTQRETLQNGIQIQKRFLKIMAGLPVEEEITLDTISAEQVTERRPSPGFFSLENLPTYQLLQKQNELAELEIESGKAAYYPNLAAFGQFSYSSYATEFQFKNFNNMNTIGLQATIPIFSSGKRKQKVLQSQLKLEQNMEDMKLNSKYLDANYKNASNSLLSAWSNLQDQKENKELANEVYEQVKLQYDEGMASLTDLLNVETSLLEAENLFNQQLLKYNLAEIELLKATGKLKTLIN